MDASNNPLINGIWTPLAFSPYSMIATENALLFGGEKALLVRAKLNPDREFEFEHIPFQPSRYSPGWPTRPSNERLAEDVSFGEPFHIDRSVTPNQVVIHFGEYQGGAYGVSVVSDINNFISEVYIPTPSGESDIAFAETLAIRGDEFIAYSCYELFHFVRDGGVWTHSQIPFPSSCDANCIELTFDAKKLFISIDDGPSQRTLVYERVHGRFVETHSIAEPYNNIYLHERTSLIVRENQLWIYTDPCLQGEPAHKIQFESDTQIADSTDEFSLVLSINTETEYYRTVKRYVRLVDNQSGLIVANFALPEVAGNSSIFSAVFLGQNVIIACQNQIGVFEIEQKIERAKPLVPSSTLPRKVGFDRAMEIFEACSRFENEDRGSQIVIQLEQIESDPTKICNWIWRGIHEGYISPAFALIRTIEKQKHLYSAQDVVTFLAAVDHDEPNVWALSYGFIESKFSKYEDTFYTFWQQTTGLLHADLGYFLAQHDIVSKAQLPSSSKKRATRELGYIFYSTHPDVTYPSYLRRLQKVWSDAEIAAGLLEYASTSHNLGNEGGQWFDLVWPFATAEQRTMLILRIDHIRGVKFFAEFFSNRKFDDRDRHLLETKLESLLAQEPAAPENHVKLKDKVHLYSDAPFFSYTFLTSAVVLILDAKNRGTGLSSVGGATFARAVLMGDLYQSCEITPDFKRTLSTLFA